jgi:hypothetical protein
MCSVSVGANACFAESSLPYTLLGAALAGVVLLVLIQGWPSRGWVAFTVVGGAVSGAAGVCVATRCLSAGSCLSGCAPRP